MRIGKIIGLICGALVVVSIILGFYYLLTLALVKVFPGLEGKFIWIFIIVTITLSCLSRGSR